MEQNRKRRNIGIIAGVVVVLLIAGISAALIVLNQPKVRLARGISKQQSCGKADQQVSFAGEYNEGTVYSENRHDSDFSRE